MSKFVDSLEEALAKAQPYRKQKEISKEDRKALIVFIPGWAAKLPEYHDLLKDTLDRLEQEKWISIWELLPFRYNNSFFSCADPEVITENLVASIEIHLRDFGSNYDKIFLLGHSLGGLIARKVALSISEKENWLNSKNNLFKKVNLILLASANRGYSTEYLPPGQQILERLTFNLPFLIKKGKRGSKCINEIRLSWLRNFSELEPSEESDNIKPIAPPTIQLIGKLDRVVKRDDSIDIYRFKNTAEKVISGANHSDFGRNRGEVFKEIIDKIIESFEHHFTGIYPKQREEINSLITPDCLVFLVHGIRDFADWHEVLEYEIHKQKPNAKVVSIRYGYFTAFQFILPLQRLKNVRIFIDRYIQEFAKNPNIPIYVAAHSYGTFLFGYAMEKQLGIEIKRAYLAGSVLPKDFSWTRFEGRLEAVRNDCANYDWPVGVLCRYLRWLPGNKNIGTAGVDGFSEESSMIKSNQYIEGGHGAALNSPVTEEIVNFLFKSQLTPDEWNLKYSGGDLKKRQLISIALGFLGLILLILLIFTLIILLSPVQWSAVIISSVFTFVVIWILLYI